MRRERLEDGSFIERHPYLGVNIYNQNGRRDVLICHNPLAPDPVKPTETPHYEVRTAANYDLEILDITGTVVCTAADDKWADLICKLLNVHKKVKG